MELNDQLRANALICKNLCLYILGQRAKKGILDTKEMERIAPDVFVFEQLDIYNEGGPLLYDEMIKDQLADIISESEMAGWNEELIKSLLTIAGVTAITKMEHDFSQRPTGYYEVVGTFQDVVPFRLYNVIGTE